CVREAMAPVFLGHRAAHAFTCPRRRVKIVDRVLASEVQESLRGRWEPVYRSQLHYHVTWGTRSRRPVLRARHVTRLQELIAQACDERGFALLACSAGAD